MFGVSDQAATFRSCCCDERSSLVATKGPRLGGGGEQIRSSEELFEGLEKVIIGWD